MIVTVTFDVDTINRALAYSTVSRIFSTLRLPDSIKSMLITVDWKSETIKSEDYRKV
jgi:hypothetical protein